MTRQHGQVIDVKTAERCLSALVDRAAVGQDVVLSRHGRPVARITRLAPPKRPVRFGLLAGQFTLPADFDAPLPPEADPGAG